MSTLVFFLYGFEIVDFKGDFGKININVDEVRKFDFKVDQLDTVGKDLNGCINSSELLGFEMIHYVTPSNWSATMIHRVRGLA